MLGSLGCVLPQIGAAQTGKRLTLGEESPGFFVKQLDGDNFFLNEYVGGNSSQEVKGILFSFCSSTCKPCKKEIPELEKLEAKYREEGLRIYLINVGESEELARKLIKEVGTGLPVLLDRYMVVANRLGVSATPYNILVDGSAIVRFINTGFAEDKTAEFIGVLEEKIAEVLAD